MSLRLASLALSPVAWIGVLTLLKTARPMVALAFCGLVRKNMREMLSLMDPYAALAISIGAENAAGVPWTSHFWRCCWRCSCRSIRVPG